MCGPGQGHRRLSPQLGRSRARRDRDDDQELRIASFPTLIVIDANGTLIDCAAYSEHERLESLVEKLLEEAEAR